MRLAGESSTNHPPVLVVRAGDTRTSFGTVEGTVTSAKRECDRNIEDRKRMREAPMFPSPSSDQGQRSQYPPAALGNSKILLDLSVRSGV